MKELDEKYPDDQITEENQVVEIEPNTGHIIDEFIPIINLTTILREDLRKLLDRLIPQA